MCGIFGLIAYPSNKLSVRTLEQLVRKLFDKSEARGKDASGILTVTDNQILIHKQAQRARLMLKSEQCLKVLAQAEHNYGAGKAYVIAGHTRMVTNGSEENECNNQPVIMEEIVMLHNGIIVNDLDLWVKHPEFQRKYQVDTEVFGALLNTGKLAGQSMPAAMQQAFLSAKGANTIAAIFPDADEVLLGTTNGSLYFWSSADLGISLFGSERLILQESLNIGASLPSNDMPVVQQVKPGSILALSLTKGTSRIIPAADTCIPDTTIIEKKRIIRQLSDSVKARQNRVQPINNKYAEIEQNMHYDWQGIATLRRCTKCLLPESFPFIEYDVNGVCQFCRQHKKKPLLGMAALNQLADQARRTDGGADCLVPISGGRDSCYGLHYIKKELGLNPVAYTYDWGFVTDLARRNISRMCGELNIEHILVAADIKQKRENVRKNVSAWLNKPNLGIIPLFMAGDKQFFYYATKIKNQMGLGPILYSMNWLEKTGFKTGFAGVNDTADHEKTHGLTKLNQFKLIYYYGANFLSNAGYLNSSIFDTLFGYASFYMKSKDYYQLFDFLNWDQNEIERSIIDGYNWETSPDTKSTWRIGDGTVPFYNYIYLTIAGFTENDTFRSNQIREGILDRATALHAIQEENNPRAESFKWYCDAIGLDAIMALKAINRAKKLYKQS
jgi:hypothetical protein